ncbi:hypothetical protein [Rhodococcus sp. LW-XY12]|uniref:hypothetical protein n=1 Tax=Rhodococcus sp. LW-XY12 TaxID=2856851 RepID=UPI001C570E54|nr:hypothetical protein [Rhodococcus sp. LW-XY12]QXU53606.1 hypothetical protein KXC42_23250 [Rhodococcus sp. LW-XY12]
MDIIARNVIEKVGDEIEQRAQAAVRIVVEQAKEDLTEIVGAATPRPVPPVTPVIVGAGGSGGGGGAGGASLWPSFATESAPAKVDAKTDAKDRAWRTLAQGLFVTVLVAIITAFGTAVAAPEFDLLTWDSWRAAATASGTAAVMAVTAYVQRLLSPPKSTGTR